ncbi:hypothetical protein V8V91_09780 [Algoriphagus halophilus]
MSLFNHCIYDLDSKAPSIDTPLHAFTFQTLTTFILMQPLALPLQGRREDHAGTLERTDRLGTLAEAGIRSGTPVATNFGGQSRDSRNHARWTWALHLGRYVF